MSSAMKKLLSEINEFIELSKKVTVEKDGTIIVSKELKTKEERDQVVARFRELLLPF